MVENNHTTLSENDQTNKLRGMHLKKLPAMSVTVAKAMAFFPGTALIEPTQLGQQEW